MSNRKIKDLTKGSVPKLLWVFSIPILFSNIFETVNSSINTMWVGRFLGDSALAATINANFIIFLMFSLVFGFGLAASTYIGRYIGMGELENARKFFGTAIGATAILSIVSSALGFYYCDFILNKLSTPKEVILQASIYSKAIFVALPPNLILWVIMLSLRGIGDSMTAMWYMVITVVLDAIFNPLLIGGLYGFPKLGIGGSGCATAIANYGSLILLCIHLYVRKSPLCLRDHQLSYLFTRWFALKRMVSKGVPICLQMLFLASSGLIMISFVNKEGASVLASYNIALQLWMYLQMPAMAVSSAVGAMVAQNIGAGLWERVFLVSRWGVFICIAMSCSLLAIFFLFGENILSLFFTNGAGAKEIAYAKHIQYLASWSYILFGIATIFMATLRSNGIVMLPLVVVFLAVYPVRIGFYYFSYHYLGADAIWISFPVGALFCLVVTYGYYLTDHWRKHETI